LKFLHFSRKFLLGISDWFYTPFQRYIPLQTFRYAFFGGSNVVLDTFLYFITFNFVLQKHDVNLYITAIKAHNAALFIKFPITFVTGFLLSKYITFNESELRGKTQLFRYGITVLICIILNYIFINFFVQTFGIFPTVASILSTCLVVVYSYFSQKYFTFRMASTSETVAD
jgi:putative flippase GtrA